MVRYSLLAVTSCLLVACSSVSTDPNKGGFIGGLKGVVGGEYDNRLSRKQNEVDELQELNAMLARRLESTKSERSAVGMEIEQLSNRLNQSKATLDISRGRLDSALANKTIEEMALKEIKLEQQRLETLMLELTLITASLDKEEKQASSISPDISRPLSSTDAEIKERVQKAELKEKRIAQDIANHINIVDRLFANPK
ncbi:hypothetical protein N474_09565 [Pseudoalteromonas luteoviolacea CPMOR-2]|uniref:Lipoprotein n=1 Tax=Pseudoalteromonas luteoviolacea DSM 6061 TaxID=1365250 RepID=A0A166VY34_9GAMM|nr:hypothetical protein [Pseudoalteromonas luteoviolacea]KZN34401.1 hypothetical protein N475_19170 [Pseudoalteromonas luteoviolacea DSM 6061]KZN56858.1 hypothetical protein N474_09565 [Pseudoalteromonas luteoviolacea CPMOR-2]MBE0389883.1 hypothetical protein [Pseudoalteromonas luteoviolacea DSM 6061]